MGGAGGAVMNGAATSLDALRKWLVLVVERVADAFQLDGLARWVFIAAAELRVGDLAVRGACGVINRFEFLHGCHMPSWQGFWEDLRHPDLGLFPEEGRGGAIQEGVVRALCIMAAVTMSPQTFDRHCCHYFRKATQRCLGVHAREFLTALHGAAGADIAAVGRTPRSRCVAAVVVWKRGPGSAEVRSKCVALRSSAGPSSIAPVAVRDSSSSDGSPGRPASPESCGEKR